MTPAGRGRLHSRFRFALALCAALVGCRDEPPLFIPWPADIDVAVIASASAGRTQILGVIHANDAGPVSGTHSLEIPANEEEVIQLLGWSRAELEARAPEIDPERWWALEVVDDPSVCASGSVASSERRRFPLLALEPRAFDLNPAAQIFSPGTVSRDALLRFAVELPLRPDRCRTQLPKRWARLDEASLPTGVILDGQPRTDRLYSGFAFDEVVRIDEQRIVVSALPNLLHLTRGVVFSDSSAERFSARSLPSPPAGVDPNGRWLLTGLALDPRTRDAAVRTLIATASYLAGPERTGLGGVVLEIDVTAEGFALPVRTSTVYWGGKGFPDAVTVDPDGGWVAVGGDGLVLRKEPGESSVQRQTIAPGPWFRRVISTSHPDARHLAGTEDGFVAVGDLRGPLEDVTVALPLDVATSVRGLLSVPGETPRVVISTFASGALELGADRTWSRLEFETLGPLGCTSVVDECGFRTLGAGPLASDRDGTVYTFSDRCGDFTVLDLTGRCASAVSIGLDGVTDLKASHGITTVVGEAGAVLELFIED